jgi:hypothetical protein
MQRPDRNEKGKLKKLAKASRNAQGIVVKRLKGNRPSIAPQTK